MRDTIGRTGRARIAMTLGSTALGMALLASTPAQGHRLDLMKAGRAGPIVREETTLRDLRRWFGPPTARKRLQVGCERVVAVRWGRKLKVYTTRERPRTVRAIFVGSRRITSAAHGELRMHTRKRLRVGNGEARLRRLYPAAQPQTHGGHTHYRLGTAPSGAYLMAKVVGGRVVRLEAWPYEFC